MDEDYYNMIVNEPWVMKILKSLYPPGPGYVKVTDQSFTLGLHLRELYFKAENGLVLKVSSEPQLWKIYLALKFMHALILARKNDEGLVSVPGFSKGDDRLGRCFREPLENYIFQQYLFYGSRDR